LLLLRPDITVVLWAVDKNPFVDLPCHQLETVTTNQRQQPVYAGQNGKSAATR